MVQYPSNIFWSRLTRVHLLSLQQCQKWDKRHNNLAMNDIVLLPDENRPSSLWPLAQVLEVYSNFKDGLVGSAKVKTKMSMLI